MHKLISKFENLREKLQVILKEFNLNFAFRQPADETWIKLSEQIAYLPVDYSAAMIDYQLCYWNGNGKQTFDLSLILLNDNRPCALWPLSVSYGESGELEVGSSGGCLRPPLFFAELSQKSIKNLTANSFAALNQFCINNGITSWQSVESFKETSGLSYWHDKVMQEGGIATLRHELFIDLTRSITEVKAGFRSRYKSLINSGQKLWNVHIQTQAYSALWDEFRRLHLSVAGRVTRSLESWDAQHKAIAEGHAFFVYLRDDVERMVGGALFHVTRDECEYAVGAYDRSLFAKPLGHVVQYHAIEEMKRRNIRWYKLGARIYSTDVPHPTPKELSIADFKQGFASHIFPRFDISRQIQGGTLSERI